jgi:hypothetical protein
LDSWQQSKKENEMQPEIALATRERMIRDGYCFVDDILTEEFLQELREESERLIDAHVPPPDVRYQGQHVVVYGKDNDVIRRLLEWKPTWQALEEMGFGDFESAGAIIILTKDPGEPALYWHQDWMDWNDPISTTPWPQKFFVSYYLSDTTIENGCLKVIPGTHLKRIPLHDQLVAAHGDGARYVEEDHPIMFSDHPDEVDVGVRARSFVLGDARLLHSARRNLTDERRTLILAWHQRRADVWDKPPANWQGEASEIIGNRDADQEYARTRVPGEYLRS